MNVSGHYHVAARPDQLWAAFRNLDLLCKCLPGCEDITRLGPGEAEVVFVARVSGVHTRFTGRVRLSDVMEGQGFALALEGEGGSAGSFAGKVLVAVAPQGVDSLVRLSGRITPAGRLAACGGPALGAVADRAAADFFQCVTQAIDHGVAACRNPPVPSLPEIALSSGRAPGEAAPKVVSDMGPLGVASLAPVAPSDADTQTPPWAGPPPRAGRGPNRVIIAGLVAYALVLATVFGPRLF